MEREIMENRRIKNMKCKYDNQEAKTQVILTNGEAWNVCEFHERLARLSDIKEIRNILANKEI